MKALDNSIQGKEFPYLERRNKQKFREFRCPRRGIPRLCLTMLGVLTTTCTRLTIKAIPLEKAERHSTKELCQQDLLQNKVFLLMESTSNLLRKAFQGHQTIKQKIKQTSS